MKAVYPGSFDPITFGHLDIIERASKLYDELVILIMPNESKKGLFSPLERKELIEECIQDLKNVSVMIGEGLTVEVAEKIDAQVIIRGIRAVSDYEYEMQLATANMTLKPNIETIFLLAHPLHSFLSSSTAKTVAANHGDLSKFVPNNVAKSLKEKYNK